MSKESIIAFSQAKAEPLWLQDLRQAAFDKIESLALPKIECVKFHRWNLGDGTITENEPSANVPDFTALGNNPKLVQVGTNTVLEQLPADLISQGVVFTDLTTALEEIPEVVEAFFGKAVAYDEDKLAAYNYAYFSLSLQKDDMNKTNLFDCTVYCLFCITCKVTKQIQRKKYT